MARRHLKRSAEQSSGHSKITKRRRVCEELNEDFTYPTMALDARENRLLRILPDLSPAGLLCCEMRVVRLGKD